MIWTSTRLLLTYAVATLWSHVAFAEPYTCTHDTTAYSPSNPSQPIGQFKKATKLEVGALSSTPEMYHVTYMGHDGKFIAALCRAEDVGKAPPKTPPAAVTSEPKTAAESKPNKPVIRKAEWLEDVFKAKQYAKSDNKLLLMDFTGSDWCSWCIKLDKEVFSTKEFKDYAGKNLILLKVDFPKRKTLPQAVQQQNQKLKSQYGIEGYPTVIVLNSEGEKVGELGYMEGGPKTFIAELEKLRR